MVGPASRRDERNAADGPGFAILRQVIEHQRTRSDIAARPANRRWSRGTSGQPGPEPARSTSRIGKVSRAAPLRGGELSLLNPGPAARLSRMTTSRTTRWRRRGRPVCAAGSAGPCARGPDATRARRTRIASGSGRGTNKTHGFRNWRQASGRVDVSPRVFARSLASFSWVRRSTMARSRSPSSLRWTR